MSWAARVAPVAWEYLQRSCSVDSQPEASALLKAAILGCSAEGCGWQLWPEIARRGLLPSTTLSGVPLYELPEELLSDHLSARWAARYAYALQAAAWHRQINAPCPFLPPAPMVRGTVVASPLQADEAEVGSVLQDRNGIVTYLTDRLELWTSPRNSGLWLV
jgi:hypothetical protein